MTDFSKQEVGELKKTVADKRVALQAFRHANAGTRTRNVREGRTLRREIAQILTELRAREIASGAKKN